MLRPLRRRGAPGGFMTLNSTTSSSSLVEIARSLYPVVSAASSRIEQERRLPDDVVAALRQSRLFRLCVP
jgi:hypothetical protein